jgi:hypothetical protein
MASTTPPRVRLLSRLDRRHHRPLWWLNKIALIALVVLLIERFRPAPLLDGVSIVLFAILALIHLYLWHFTDRR